MNAASRELVNALQLHPNSPKSVANVRRLLLSAGSDNEMKALKLDFVDLMDGVLVEAQPLPNILKQLDDNPAGNVFDAVVFSNVFTGNAISSDLEKIAEVMPSVLRLMTPGGVIIIRENLEKHGASTMVDLTQFFDVFVAHVDDKTLGLEFYSMTQLQDSICARSNFLDVYWTLSKTVEIKSTNDVDCVKMATYREFLDKTQYTPDNVQSYEWIFGENFISPGGLSENRRVLRYLHRIHPGMTMLDIGVGIGGGARQAAREFGLHVLGCDLSTHMIQHAFERLQRDKDHRVEYKIADILRSPTLFEPCSFDIVFSRDCIHHIFDAYQLFKNIYAWLKPGGQVLITMYGRGHGIFFSTTFTEYVRKRQYMLRTLEEFREKFGAPLYEGHVQGWEEKLQYNADDNQNWLLIRAEKPAHASAVITESGA